MTIFTYCDEEENSSTVLTLKEICPFSFSIHSFLLKVSIYTFNRYADFWFLILAYLFPLVKLLQ